MPNIKKRVFKHVEVVEAYRNVWRSALHDRPKAIDNPTLRAARNHRNFSGIEDLVKDFISGNPFEHHLVLSLGCGAAMDLREIEKLYPSSLMYGIDTSQEALVEAKKRLVKGNVNFVCASISNLPFKKDLRFDMLIAGQSLDLEFEEGYLRRLLCEATKYSSPRSRFYMTFYGIDKSDLELYKCTPIGNLLDELRWHISYGREYHVAKSPFAQGVFWVAERP
jgi:hypothetical protein